MLTHKQGESFGGTITYTPAAGDPSTLASITILSRIRTPGGQLIDTLNIVKAGDNMSFTFRDSAGTQDWPLGILHWDISFDFGGSVDICPTQLINVIRSASI